MRHLPPPTTTADHLRFEARFLDACAIGRLTGRYPFNDEHERGSAGGLRLASRLLRQAAAATEGFEVRPGARGPRSVGVA